LAEEKQREREQRKAFFGRKANQKT